MPWTPADAKRHKRGLSPKQARQWAHIANSVLQRCLASGRSQSYCDGAAVRQANGAVGTPARSNIRRLTIQAALTVPPSRLTLNNREYLTAPAVLIVEGVLNKGYIGGEQLMPQDWEHCCIVINHPMDGQGQAMSARSPEVLAQYGLGHLYHCALGQGQRQGHPVRSLRAELWLDVAQVQALGGEALQAMTMLEAQQPVELSTGFYSDAIPQRGTFHGVPFDEILINLRPDHLALLPNNIGACDWQSGCGAPRLSEHACACDTEPCTCHEDAMETAAHHGWRGFVHVLREFVRREAPEEDEQALEPVDGLVLEQTDTDLRESLYGCLAREMGMDSTPVFIDSVDQATQSFTYRKGERLCRRYWTMEGDVVTLTEDMEDVQRTTTYNPVPGTAGPVDDDGAEQEVYDMSQHVPTVMVKTRVNALIANPQSGWSERDRLILERMDEATLIRLEAQPQQPQVPTLSEPTTLEQALAYIPEKFGVRETLVSAVQRYERHKGDLIKILSANKTCPFSEDELQSMQDTRLEQLVVMAGEELPDHTPHHRPPADYRGRHMPQMRVVEDERDGVPEPPDTMGLVIARQKELGLR